MQDHYVINVSVYELKSRVGLRPDAQRSYKHLFATAPHSCVTKSEMVMVAASLRGAYPEPEFKVDVSHVTVRSQSVDV